MKILIVKDLGIASERRFPENKQLVKHIIASDYQRIYHYSKGFNKGYYFCEYKEGSIKRS